MPDQLLRDREQRATQVVRLVGQEQLEDDVVLDVWSYNMARTTPRWIRGCC